MEETTINNQQPITNNQKPGVFKRYWFVVMLAFIATILGIVKILFLQDEPAKTPTTSQESWNGITPGKSTKQDVLSTLGEPLSQTPDGSTLFYAIPNSEQYHEVFLEGQKIDLVKNKEIAGNLSDYKKKYGETEGEYFGPHKGVGYKVYVYASKGVALTAHQSDGGILEIWYFSPMTVQQFFAKWSQQEDLSVEEKSGGY